MIYFIATGNVLLEVYAMTIREEAYMGRPVSAFVVDSHTHISPYYMSGWYETPKLTGNGAIVSMMDRLGIDRIVTAPHYLVLGMMERANISACEAAKMFPGRIYGYISVCPGEDLGIIRNELERYKKDPSFLGLKFLPGYHGQITQDGYSYALDFADEMRCPVLIHTWGGSPPLSDIGAIAAKRHRMKLLCAHQGGGSAAFSNKLAEIMKDHPNLYMELCGSLNNTLSVEDLVSLVGGDRLIYGSDLINLDPRYDLGRVIFSTLSDETKKKVLAENYLEILKDSQMGKISNLSRG